MITMRLAALYYQDGITMRLALYQQQTKLKQMLLNSVK